VGARARRRIGAEVRVPPLAARRADLPHLARLFAADSARALGVAPPAIEEGALAWLWQQEWPGNLRQLESTIHRAVAASASSSRASLAVPVLERCARREGLEAAPRVLPSAAARELVLAALEASRTPGGTLHRSRAARLLGWHPDTLARRARELQLGTKTRARGKNRERTLVGPLPIAPPEGKAARIEAPPGSLRGTSDAAHSERQPGSGS
jgi:DNA-binding NtrC family response regulator